MSELIDRNKAYLAIEDLKKIHFDRTVVITKAQKTIMELPTVEPKRDKWILDRSGAYCCSECMEPCSGYVMMKPRDKFCKMCGAKMEGADDE